MACVYRIGGGDESECNRVKLALASIFHKHSALRASLKKSAEEERNRQVANNPKMAAYQAGAPQ
jgi:hypothetical protein